MNAVSALLFIKCQLHDYKGASTVAKVLVDSGCTLTLVTKQWLMKSGLSYKPEPFSGLIKSYTGNLVPACGTGEFLIDFGTGKQKLKFVVIDLEVHYEIVFGLDLQRSLGLSTIMDGERSHFLHKGVKILFVSLNDDIHQAANINSAEEFPLKISQNITLIGGDIYMLLVEAEVEANVYDVTMDDSWKEKGLKLLVTRCLFTPATQRSKTMKSSVKIKFEGTSSQFISLVHGEAFGTIKPLTETPEVVVECMSQIDAEKCQSPVDKVVVWPAKVDPSPEKIKAIEEAQARRKSLWTREEIIQESPWLEAVPEAFRGDVVDILLEAAPILSRGMLDLREGLKFWEIKGKIPPDFFKTCHYQPPGVVMRRLFERSQEFMIKNGLAQPCMAPKCVHPFSLVMKKNKSVPATTDVVDNWTAEQLWSTVRIIQDCSMLTADTKHSTAGFLPGVSENICRLRFDSEKSFFDLTSAFNQIPLSEEEVDGVCIRDLFCFHSYIPGQDYLHNTRGVMGFSPIMEICCFTMSSILDRCSAVPLHASLSQFNHQMRRIDKGMTCNLEGKIYADMCVSFADDGSAQSPTSDFDSYGLKLWSYYKKPTNEVEAAVYLHLQVLRKIFSNMQFHNCLIQPSKMSLLCGLNFEHLGWKFAHLRDGLYLMMPDKKRELLLASEKPTCIRELQAFLGFCAFYSTLSQNGKALVELLLQLMRKETPYTWTELQQKCFDLIKSQLETAALKGFSKLIDGTLLCEILVFTDWSKMTRSVVCFCEIL